MMMMMMMMMMVFGASGLHQVGQSLPTVEALSFFKCNGTMWELSEGNMSDVKLFTGFVLVSNFCLMFVGFDAFSVLDFMGIFLTQIFHLTLHEFDVED